VYFVYFVVLKKVDPQRRLQDRADAPEAASSALVERGISCYGLVMNVSDEILDFLVD
jgi:hypothetical protein